MALYPEVALGFRYEQRNCSCVGQSAHFSSSWKMMAIPWHTLVPASPRCLGWTPSEALALL
eukprot:6907426-Lingulodinium_polyedra.AAC.1